MTSIIRPAVITTLCALAALTAVAIAQERKAGDQLVYTVQMGGGTGAKLMSSDMTVAIDSVDPDGSAHTKISMSMPGAGKTTVEAAMSPAGELITKLGDTKPSMSMSKSAAAAMSMNSMLGIILGPFNGLASGAAAHGALRLNDSWHGTAGLMPIDLTYKVTGTKEVSGHQATVVSIQSENSGMGQITGEGYYDPAAHLVVGIHSEMKGQAAGQSSVTDIMLKP